MAAHWPLFKQRISPAQPTAAARSEPSPLSLASDYHPLRAMSPPVARVKRLSALVLRVKACAVHALKPTQHQRRREVQAKYA